MIYSKAALGAASDVSVFITKVPANEVEEIIPNVIINEIIIFFIYTPFIMYD